MHLVTPPPLDSKSIEENIIKYFLCAYMCNNNPALWPKHRTRGPLDSQLM